MSYSAIPNQPIKFWSAFDQARNDCQKQWKKFCLPVDNDDNLRFALDDDGAFESQLFTNSDFSSGLEGWGGGGDGNAWSTGSDDCANTAEGLSNTKILGQAVTIKRTACYTLCLSFCGNPTASSNNIEIGYDANLGAGWQVLETLGFSGNTEICVILDGLEIPIEGVPSWVFSIGIRIVSEPENSVTYFVDTLTLTENNCGIEVVDCDCETTYAVIKPTYSGETQKIYTLNPDDLGLEDGQYRLKHQALGCSNCIRVGSFSCSYLLSFGDNESGVFGITWSALTSNQYFNFRVAKAELRFNGYEDEESEIYRDSAQVNKLVYFNKSKQYKLLVDQLPEYLHDVLATMVSGSNFMAITIDGERKRFRPIPDSYEVEITKDSDLYNGSLLLVEYEQATTINPNSSKMSD